MFERMNPNKTAPELQKPMFALTKHISQNIDPVLFELVKLRASMINGCGHCVDIHSSDALKAGESTARLFGLSAWWEHPLYSSAGLVSASTPNDLVPTPTSPGATRSCTASSTRARAATWTRSFPSSPTTPS